MELPGSEIPDTGASLHNGLPRAAETSSLASVAKTCHAGLKTCGTDPDRKRGEVTPQIAQPRALSRGTMTDEGEDMSSFDGRRRVVIDAVRPQVGGYRHPVKR